MNLLFLGDSITDCGHCFSADGLGDGYVTMIAQKLSAKPGAPCLVTNGGTDGFTFPRIYRKWRRQYAAGRYEIVTILGGINEVGAIAGSGMAGRQADSLLTDSEQALSLLLRHLAESSHVRRILLAEPFLFPWPAYLQNWMPTLERVRRMIRSAVSFANAESVPAGGGPVSLLLGSPAGHPCELIRIPLQPALDAYAREHGFASVTEDGIHLTSAGHRILCDCLLPFL